MPESPQYFIFSFKKTNINIMVIDRNINLEVKIFQVRWSITRTDQTEG